MLDQLAMTPRFVTASARYAPTFFEAAVLHAAEVGALAVRPDHWLWRHNRLPDVAIANRNAKATLKGRLRRSTLVEGVSSTTKSMPDEVEALLSGTRGTKPGTPLSFALEAFERHIERSWLPGARHVAFLSSGWDSRLMLALLRRIYARRGAAWLGPLRVCAVEPEVEGARAIWEYLDWPEETWAPVEGGPEDYWRDYLTFQNAGDVADVHRFLPHGWTIADRLGFRPVQGLEGGWTISCRWNLKLAETYPTLAHMLGAFLFEDAVLPQFPEVEFIQPWVCREWMQWLCGNRLALSEKDFRWALLQHLDPKLAAFPNWRFQVGAVRKRIGVPYEEHALSKALQDEMAADYAASWYAKNVGPAELTPGRYMEFYSGFTTHYLRAAILERLKRADVELRLGAR